MLLVNIRVLCMSLVACSFKYVCVCARVCMCACVCELCDYTDVYFCMFTYVLEALYYKAQGRWFGSLRCN